MSPILFLTKNYDFQSGRGYDSGSGYESGSGYDSGSGYESGSGYDSGSGYESDNTELKIHIKLNVHPAIYFILSVVGLIVLLCICSSFNKYTIDSKIEDTETESWSDFVTAMEGHMDVLAYAFVQSQQKEEKIKSENENYLDFNNEKDKEKYLKFSFNDAKTECYICHEQLMNNETSTDMNIKNSYDFHMYTCGHTVHKKCYEDYKHSEIVTNNTFLKCPVCRD